MHNLTNIIDSLKTLIDDLEDQELKRLEAIDKIHDLAKTEANHSQASLRARVAARAGKVAPIDTPAAQVTTTPTKASQVADAPKAIDTLAQMLIDRDRRVPRYTPDPDHADKLAYWDKTRADFQASVTPKVAPKSDKRPTAADIDKALEAAIRLEQRANAKQDATQAKPTKLRAAPVRTVETHLDRAQRIILAVIADGSRHSIAELAQRCAPEGISLDTINHAIRRLKIARSGKGKHPHVWRVPETSHAVISTTKTMTPELEGQIRKLIAAGFSQKEIVSQLGVSLSIFRNFDFGAK